MATFQNLEFHCSELAENQKAKDALEALRGHKLLLKRKATDKVEEWKRRLDESLASVHQDIDVYFGRFAGSLEEQMTTFDDLWQDGQSQQGAIREILDRTTDKI